MAKQNIEDIYPLSPLQEGFLYDHELDPSSAAYWNQLTCRIRGQFPEASFRQAWQIIVDRHAVLRTRFVRDRQGRAFQVVEINAALQSHYEDLSDISAARQKDAIEAYEVADRQPPPLDACPLMRLALFKLGENEHRVFWSYHHIILDGWSEAAIWREFLAANHDIVSSRSVSLPTIEPYSRYIAWLAHQDREDKERFWKDYLDGYLPPSRIASQLETPGNTQYSELTRELSAERSDAVRRLAARYRLTLNTLLQGAWALVLSAETGSADVVFGTTLADRAPDLAGAESIIGLLLATVPVRYRTDSSKPVVQWLSDAQNSASEMMGYTGLSLSDIKSVAGMSADAPVFDVLYGFDHGADGDQIAESGDDHEFEVTDVERFGRTGYPFAMVVLPIAKITLATSFDTATISERWCARALDRLDCILGRICEKPETAVSQLNWLTGEELELLSAQDAATRSEFPDRLTVDQWVASIVDEYAANPAVVFGTDTLTYREFRNRTENTSHTLTEQGIQAGDSGRAVANTTVRVVDRQQRILPPGVPGELCIGGAGMSSGYLNDTPLTSSRFVTIGNERKPQKYFRTGEFVMMRSDGLLQYYGRLDDQITIRGRRIDPREVETELSAILGIATAFVTGQTSDSGDQYLVAYYVPDEAARTGLEINSIDDRIAEQLSPHLVPACFIAIPELPITRDGRIDLSMLPDPVSDDPVQSRQSLTLIEQKVAKLWGELLGPGDLHRDDDFVQLGGHSLLLARLRSQLLEEFGCELSMAELYANTGLGAQAILVGSCQGEGNVTAVERATDRQRFPLSPAQRRLWFLEQIEPSSGVFNIAGAYRLVGDLDVERLESAFSQMAARHEILRTRIIVDGGEPFQEILAEPHLDWSIETVPAVDELRARLSELTSQVFDLADRPPWMVRLFPIDGLHVLFMNFHHMLLDGESVPVLFSGLSTCYENGASSSGVPDTPLQYGDFATWQQNQVESGAYEDELAYWQAELAGELPTLRFPSFVERPPEQSFSGASISTTLDGDLVQQLRTFAGSRDISLFNLLMAGFSALLMRYCRQTELVIGSPAGALRHSVDAEQSLGPYINTLAFRFHAKAGWTFDEYLDHVVSKVNGALCHQEIPFEQVVGALSLARDASRTPVFQTMFAYRLGTEDRWQLPSIHVIPEPVDRRTARTDLSFWVVDDDDSISLELEYASDLFDKRITTAFLGQFERFLRHIVSDNQKDWMTVQLMGQADFQRVVSDWNQTNKVTPASTIGDLIWQRARKYPDRIAVSSRRGELTYGQLEQQSRSVAATLTASGIGAGDFVGLAVTRSERLLVAILGILEAGAAYVPLDPDLPAERLQFLLDDSNVRNVVSDTHEATDLSRFSCRMIDLDDLSDPDELDDGSPCPVPPGQPDTAYLIFTSGSTGVPKGVEVGHSQVVNLLMALEEPLQMVQEDVLAAVTTTSFDISILELLLPLMVGARVHVVSESVTMDGALLAEEIGRSGASIMQATPATWRMLLDAGWQGDPNLRILCGGEAISLQLARSLRPRCQHLWNMYGPTETTVWSTFQQIDDEPGHISIGRPIANTCVYILDEQRSPLPIGVEGEIYIAGQGVAKGYRGRAELTEQHFMTDPFSADPEQRMYRTGDLGRWRPDGTLEHRGRIDTQLKLRGYRIEAGDVESHLLTAPGVSQAAVTIRTGAGDDERLVAYVVLEQTMMLDAMELRRHLRERVPVYMIPQHFIALDSLPMTDNRKVDYKQLPQLTIIEAVAPAKNEPPNSPNEKLIAQIWSELLGVENISRSDNFFELGGHSLLTIQVIVRVLEQTDAELAPQHFFNSTLSGIAAELDARGSTRPGLGSRATGKVKTRLGALVRRLFSRYIR